MPMSAEEITRRINGGFNGLEDRERFYAVAREILGVPVQRAGRGARSRKPRTERPRVFERGAEAIRAASQRKPATTRKGSRR